MRFSLAVFAALLAAAAAAAPGATLRLRGGGVLSSLSEKLGWHKDKVGPSELGKQREYLCIHIYTRIATCLGLLWGGTSLLDDIYIFPAGCGPMPQVKPADRHTKEGEKLKKDHDGSGYTRSHSVVIPDVAGQR